MKTEAKTKGHSSWGARPRAVSTHRRSNAAYRHNRSLGAVAMPLSTLESNDTVDAIALAQTALAAYDDLGDFDRPVDFEMVSALIDQTLHSTSFSM